MNRIIAPVALAIAIALTSVANAAPQNNNQFATQLFSDLARNGN